MERVTHPDAKASVLLREDLRYIIVGNQLSLVKLCEDSFSEDFLDCFQVYLRESGEYAVLPVTVSE
jgi:hypothetical protein